MINCQSPNATSGTHREWSRVQNEQVVIESEPDRPCVCGATCKIVLVFNTKTGPSSLCPIFIIATQSFIHFRPSPTQPSPFAVVAHASVTCTRMHRLMMMHARIASIWCPASFAARSGISSGDIDSVLSERHCQSIRVDSDTHVGYFGVHFRALLNTREHSRCTFYSCGSNMEICISPNRIQLNRCFRYTSNTVDGVICIASKYVLRQLHQCEARPDHSGDYD